MKGEYALFNKKNAVVRTKKYTKLIRLLVVIALVIATAGFFAYGWQHYEETKYPEGTEKDYSLPDAFLNFARLINDFITQNADNKDNEPTNEPDNSSRSNSEKEDHVIIVGDSSNSSSEQISLEEVIPEVRGGIVERRENASYYSFSNSYFVGDYFVSQAKSLGYFEYSKYAYVEGLDMNTILTKKAVKTENGNVTLSEYLKTVEDAKAFYIMFSAESISWMDFPTFVKKYTTFVDEIIKNHPDAHIYIQPILPINEEKTTKRGYSVTNSKIDQINEYLYSYAVDNNIWILDMADEFEDENGIMSAQYTTNGIRFDKEAYLIWDDYIVTHKAH